MSMDTDTGLCYTVEAEGTCLNYTNSKNRSST